MTGKRFFRAALAALLASCAVSTASAYNPTGSASVPLSKWYAQGALLTYSAATVCSYTSGLFRDNANAANITVSASTVDLTVVGAGGLDQTVITPTGSSSSPTITASASVYSSFSSAALSGTMGSNSTQLFGNSATNFDTEFAVNDVVRVGAFGSARIASIESPHNATLKAALPGGNATAGSSGTVYYSPTIWIGSTATDKRMVNTVNDAGTAIVVDVVPGALGTVGAGAVLTVGVVPNLTSESTINYWFYVWARSGTTATTVTWSTQRITPYSLSGYATSLRRIGAFPIVGGNATATLAHCDQREGSGFQRDTFYTAANNTENCRVLSNGSVQGTWTAVSCANVIPPTSRLGGLVLGSTAGNVGNCQLGWSERGRQVASGSGSTAIPSNIWLGTGPNSTVSTSAPGPVGADQTGMYITNSASGAYVDVDFFRDVLTQ